MLLMYLPPVTPLTTIPYFPAMPGTSPLRILQWNANGLRTKLHELLLFLLALRIQVALVQETHLDPSVDINSACSFGYQVYRKDRDRHGGGLLTLVL